jgi:hypothetical protein
MGLCRMVRHPERKASKGMPWIVIGLIILLIAAVGFIFDRAWTGIAWLGAGLLVSGMLVYRRRHSASL